MEFDADELRAKLERYHAILKSSADQIVVKLLRDLIADTEARLRLLGEAGDQEG